MWFLALAQAGSLSLAIEMDGEKSKVEIDDVAACVAMHFKTGAFPDTLEVNATVSPQEDATLHVDVEVKQRRDDGKRTVELHPTLAIVDGKRGVVTVRADGQSVTLEVVAKDFGGEVCPSARRTRSSEIRTRD